MTFRNPTPVVVGLIPVKCIDGGFGLLCIRRGNDTPGAGKLALPGGYLEIEDWRLGLTREVLEELGELIPPENWSLYDLHSGRNDEVLLVFAQSRFPLYEKDLVPFEPNHEVADRVIIREPCELAFPAHTVTAKRFFKFLLC